MTRNRGRPDSHEGRPAGKAPETTDAVVSRVAVAAYEQLELFEVDGPRPAVKYAVAARHRWEMIDSEYLVILMLALDSFDGHVSAPGWRGLDYGTGMTRSRTLRAVNSLEQTGDDDRPPLLAREPGKGRTRTRFVMLFAHQLLWVAPHDPQQEGSGLWVAPHDPQTADGESVVGRTSGSHEWVARCDPLPALPSTSTPFPYVTTDRARELDDGWNEDQREDTDVTECRNCGRPFARGANVPPDRKCSDCRKDDAA